MDDATAPSIRLEDFDDIGGGTRPCLIVLSGHTIGRVYPLDRPKVVIGRAADADVQIDVPGISRRHASIHEGEEGNHVLEDLGSTNGTYIEGERVEKHVLRNGERMQLGSGTVLKFSIQTAVEEAFQQRLYRSATHDHLTSAYNRRFFDDHLGREMSHTRRHGTPLALLTLDVDHFKNINDTYGHPTGDEVLKLLGQLVAASIRHEDVFCRVGGEEFAVVMRDADPESARLFAERLRGLIEVYGFEAGSEDLTITVSVGVASYDPKQHGAPTDLVEAADKALYEAKKTGRNRVCVG